jgi:hypothetical protein
MHHPSTIRTDLNWIGLRSRRVKDRVLWNGNEALAEHLHGRQDGEAHRLGLSHHNKMRGGLASEVREE